MSGAVKMPLIKIEITEGKKQKHYLVHKDDARAIEVILKSLEENTNDHNDFIDAKSLYPELADPIKAPAVSLHGHRLRMNLTQKEMAKKIGVSQGDLSKMEKGERPIGRKLALRIGKALGIDYRRFL